MEISELSNNEFIIFSINNFKACFDQLTFIKVEYCDCNRKL